MFSEQLGYIGNIWVRQNFLEKAGDKVGGHIHYFDHVSLLAKGSISVKIDDQPAKEFHAPTFLIIRKEHRHEVTALEDDTSWYCVFAVRDLDGNVETIVSPENDPWFAFLPPEDYWEKRSILEQATRYDS